MDEELIREQLEALRLPYFVDVVEAYVEEMEQLPSSSRVAFAASVAERVLQAMESADEDDREADPEDWRDLLEAVWEALGGDEDALKAVRQAVDDIGDNYTEVHDVDAVAAVLYAAHSLVYDDPEAAALAGERGFDAATLRAEEDGGGLITPQPPGAPGPGEIREQVRLAAHPLVQAEIRRQRAALDLLRSSGPEASVLARLRAGNRTRGGAAGRQ